MKKLSIYQEVTLKNSRRWKERVQGGDLGRLRTLTQLDNKTSKAIVLYYIIVKRKDRQSHVSGPLASLMMMHARIY